MKKNGKNIPAWASFKLNSPSLVDQISILAGLDRPYFHITKFKLEVKAKGEGWTIPSGREVITVRDTVTMGESGAEDIITLPDGQEVVMVTFDEMDGVEEVKVTVLDTDADNKNTWLAEIMIQKQKDCQVTTHTCSTPDWTPLSDHCYKIFLPTSHWSAAETACSTAGGHLASAGSQAVNMIIKQLATDKTTSTVLLGGKKTGDEYFWPGGVGDMPGYTNFAPGHPVAGDCILLSSQTGQWTTVDCSSPARAFVCQMDSSGNEVYGRHCL